jgi:hypothetical protein
MPDEWVNEAISAADKAIKGGDIKTQAQYNQFVLDQLGSKLASASRQVSSQTGVGGVESDVAKRVAAAEAVRRTAEEKRKAAVAKSEADLTGKGTGGDTTVNIDLTVDADGATATATTEDDADLILED